MNPRILIVDDQIGVRFALADYFSLNGYDTDCAADLSEALTQLKTTRYGLVVTDLRLTHTDCAEGLEIIRFVREHCPGTLVVLLSGYLLPGIEAEARARGASMVLDKGTGLFDIMPALFRLLEERPCACTT